MSSQVVIKGKKDRLIINLDSEIDFLELSEILKTKIIEAKAFIGSSRLAIEFSGRPLTNDEENTLIGIITGNSDIIISYVFSEKINSKNYLKIMWKYDNIFRILNKDIPLLLLMLIHNISKDRKNIA